MEWLSPGTRNKTHEDKRKEKAKDTCVWFLESDQFQQWTGDQGPSLLYCHGKGTRLLFPV